MLIREVREQRLASYILGQVRVEDPAIFSGYVSGFRRIFAQFGGRVLAVNDHPAILEGEGEADRLVLLEFADRAAALRFWNSPEYREIVRYRHAAAESRVLLFDGADVPPSQV